MNVPILLNHLPSAVLGRMLVEDGQLMVEFREPMQYETFTKLFPGISFCITEGEAQGDRFTAIRKARIYEFSVTPDMQL